MGTDAGATSREPADRDEEHLQLLRARVYGRDPHPDDVAALTAALAGRRASASLPATTAEALRPAPAATSPSGSAPEAAGPARPALPILVLAVPAVVAAFVAGSVLGPAVGQRSSPLPSIAPAQAPGAIVVQPAPGGARALLARPQHRSDVPITPPNGDLVAQSFRRLAVLPGPSVVLYGAQTTEGQICLVAITVDAHITATCARDADFRLTACSIDLSVTKDPASDDPKDIRTEITATWSYDGALRAGPVS